MASATFTTEESRLAGKVEVICERVVRGQHAVDHWKVKAHLLLRVASIILSTLGGAGLVAVNVNPDLPKQAGWALLGSLISLVLSILLQLAREFGIEQFATQARSAGDAFSVIETNLDIVLGDRDPTDLVNKLLEEANTLWIKFNAVVPRPSPAFDAEAKRSSDNKVNKYRQHWQLPEARRQPKQQLEQPAGPRGHMSQPLDMPAKPDPTPEK